MLLRSSVPEGSAKLFLAISLFMAVCLTPACEKQKVISNPETPTPYGYLSDYSHCKSFDSSRQLEASPDQDCIAWRYNEDGKLILKHVNAGFNCCPEELYADITISADTITISEHEKEALCHCLCLYDLDYEILNLEPGTYTIRFEEPYVQETDPALETTIDLVSAPAGNFCVKRSGYPWHESGAFTGPQGRIVRASGCGHSTVDPSEYPSDLSCIEWHFVGDILRIWHFNAAFNCCATIGADFKINDSVIAITEWETGPPCDCMCLYDVEYEIAGLAPGTYRVILIEPYRRPGDEGLEFTMDLANFPEGVQCAYRSGYPWGYTSTLREDEARLKDMRQAIIDFIGTPSCNDDRECRYIGLGRKPCGGPWSYIIYSASSLNEYELRYRVLRYNAWNHGMNCRHKLLSTCDIPPVPNPVCLQGICKEDLKDD